MNRKEIIEQAASSIIYDGRVENLNYLEDELEKKNQEIFKKILFDFHCFFKELKLRDDKKIKCISIYFLHATLQNGEYCLQLEAYDENLFLDTNPIIKMVDVSCILEWYAEEFRTFQSKLEKKVIQVRFDEVMKYQSYYARKYLKLIGGILEKMVPHIVRLRSFIELDNSSNIMFTYGEFYSKVMWAYNVNDRNEKNEILPD